MAREGRAPPCPAGPQPHDGEEIDFDSLDREYRRYLNRRQLTSDLTGNAVGAVIIAVCATRLLIDGLWGAAIIAFSSTVLSLATTAFITYFPMRWVAHRELLFCLCFLFHYSVAAFIGASGMNFLSHHAGSCFRLVVHFFYSNSAIWHLFNVLLCRMVFRRLAVMQLLLVMVALPWSGRLCRDALTYPGSLDVITRLFRNISQLSLLYASPAVPLSSPSSPSAEGMCCVINMWTLVLCGLIVPLYFTYHAEEHGRMVFLRTWRQSGSAQHDGGGRRHSLAASVLEASNSLPHRRGIAGLDVGAAVIAAPPMVLGRTRHRRLQQTLRALQQDTTVAAERQQEAVLELLRPLPPRHKLWVAAEGAFLALLSWPLIVLLVESCSSWLCTAQ